MHGVGFAVRNSLLKTTCFSSIGSPRILTQWLNTTKGPTTIVSAHAPTLAASTEENNEFYGNLSATTESISKSDFHIKNRFSYLVTSMQEWVMIASTSGPATIGSFGVGNMNKIGQRLLKFFCYYNLVVTNSYVNTKLQHKVPWRHPRSKSGISFI